MGNYLSIQQHQHHQGHDQWLVALLPPRWSDILPEIVGLVVYRLAAHVDLVHFAAVCTKWYHATQQASPLPPSLPLLALPNGTMYSLAQSKSLYNSDGAGYSSVCGKWLVFSSNDGHFLKDRLTNTIVKLPSTPRVRCQYVGNDGPTHGMTSHQNMIIMKLIFGSSSLVAAIVVFGESLRIAVCKPGDASWWSVHMCGKFDGSFDTTFLQGTLYALDLHDNGLIAIDISVDDNTGDPWVSQFRHVIQGNPTYSIIPEGNHVAIKLVDFLVESGGKVLMARRTLRALSNQEPVGAIENGHTKFDVFEANLEKLQWTNVTTIGNDRVLFLRQSCSKSVCVSHHDMPRDHIAFLENDIKARFLFTTPYQSCCRVYDMKEGKVSTPLPMISWISNDLPPAWIFPKE